MLITDFSEQNFTQDPAPDRVSFVELVSAGMIFILPIIFLLIISGS